MNEQEEKNFLIELIVKELWRLSVDKLRSLLAITKKMW